MKNILKKNSRKVNVNCGALDCYEKQPEKEVEIYKPIEEDAPVNLNKSSAVLTKDKEEARLSASSESSENVVDLKSDCASTDTKMVQDDGSTTHDGADEQMLGSEDNEKLAEKREEVKFIKGDHQNGDAKIDIGAVNGKAFTGMTKEELMKYANDPFWVRLRWIFFIAFWLIWLGMLVGAVLIIVGAPKCAAPEPLPWYKLGVLAKFSDFDTSAKNVEAIKQIKAGGVIHELPADLTYRVHEPEVEEKIKNLVSQYKATEANVILDITPNYVGKNSKLMKEAMDDESKRSAFIWIESTAPPNNWVSLVNGSAWDEVFPGNYVLSQFGDGLYDLHMNDTIVKKELDSVLKHIIQLGVKGIRLKNSKWFILSKQFRDELPGTDPRYHATDYGFWTHTQTTFQSGLGDVLYEYLGVVKNTSAEAFLSVADDIIKPEVYQVASSGFMGVDIPMYGHFVKSLSSPKGKNLRAELMNVMRDAGNNTWMQWNVADLPAESDVSPISVTLFMSLLPGTPVVDLAKSDVGNETEILYKNVNKFRSSPSYMHGNFSILPVEPLLVYTRIKSNNPGFLVVFNPTDVVQKLNGTGDSLPDNMDLVASNDFNATSLGMSLSELEVSPHSTVILLYAPKSE